VTESKVAAAVRKLLEDMSEDVAEERVVQYLIREVQTGRKVSAVLTDPFVRNRLSDERIAHVLENPAVLDAVENEIRSSYETRDFHFKE
jgi:hypothetical protein